MGYVACPGPCRYHRAVQHGGVYADTTVLVQHGSICIIARELKDAALFDDISRKKSTARHTALRSTSRAITVLDSTAVPAKLLENREIPHNCTYIL